MDQANADLKKESMYYGLQYMEPTVIDVRLKSSLRRLCAEAIACGRIGVRGIPYRQLSGLT